MRSDKILLISIIFLLTLTTGYGIKCASELQGSTGTCIDKSYNMLFSAGTAYYSCDIIVDDTLWYYELCTGTVSTNTKTSDSGSIVAEYWSNDAGKVSACIGRDGLLCNVQPIFGFKTDTNLDYVGYCDASNENCVKCLNNIEVKVFNGSAPKINAEGNYLCESGCGAAVYCDERAVNTWSNNRLSPGSPFEAYCDDNCLLGNTRCRSAFGAHNFCDYKNPDDVCNTDYCDANNRLVDYNGNNILDNVYCDSNCGCDETVRTLLCDSNCGASSSCHRQDIGYNNGNAGCTNSCAWTECGLYKWDNSNDYCFNSCTSSLQCYGSAVCDLVGQDINTCVLDNEAPIVLLNTPLNNSRFSSGSIGYSFSVSDNADLILDCSYYLNSAGVDLGLVNNGATYSNTLIIVEENWYEFYIKCADDSNNNGYSNTNQFLFDQTPPSFTNLGYTDLTWTVDNTTIEGDIIAVHADWTDNFGLDYSILWYRVSGGWIVGPTHYHSWTKSNSSVFLFNTSGYGGQTLQFRIRTSDTAGNVAMTDSVFVSVQIPSDNILVEMREGTGNVTNAFEFVADARAENNVKAVDSVSTVLVGDFVVRHVGVGTTIRNLFSLNNPLPDGVQIKLSGANNPGLSAYLTTIPEELPFCNNMIPGQSCEVWMWMDIASSVPPTLNINSVEIVSEVI